MASTYSCIIQGPRGEKGDKGVMGPTGLMGPTGAVGPTGPMGQQGINGTNGLQGQQGVPGRDGLQGPQGLQGVQGPIGPAGPAGPAGQMGPMGPMGLVGDIGPTGPIGATGPKGGPPGPVGPTGPAGPESSLNLIDGNTVGSIRGLYTSTDYPMGQYAVAVNVGGTASGEASFSEGAYTAALSVASHAEGRETIAGGYTSHAEGIYTKAVGNASHAEGSRTTTTGYGSHAEGNRTTASGYVTHAQGEDTIADRAYSSAAGLGVTTKGIEGAFIIGRYGDAEGGISSTGAGGIPSTDADNGTFGFFLGNGIDENNRGLGAKLLKNGNLFIDGGLNFPASDYAELFESINGEQIDVGYFVTFEDEDKIRVANSEDKYILGITSATPGILGNAGELRWSQKYQTDEWGRVKYGEVKVVKREYENENIVEKECIEINPLLNSEWDNSKQYISRLKRKEWISVGLLGQIRVRDNGKCEANNYCTVGDGGIAIPSNEGYRVLKRTGYNQILILFNTFADYRHVGKFNKELEEKQDQIDKLQNELDQNNKILNDIQNQLEDIKKSL